MPKSERNSSGIGISKTVIVDGQEVNQRGALPGSHIDSDLDGVPDSDDLCPNSEPPVDLCGCSKPNSDCCVDSDGDNVANCYDRCPHTHPGLQVDASGCVTQKLLPQRIILDLKFDWNRYELTAGHAKALAPVVALLRGQPELAIQLEGHADATGSSTYNMALSLNRAKAVAAYLIERGGLEPSRISVTAFGEERPIVTAGGPEAWWINRRVNGLLHHQTNAD